MLTLESIYAPNQDLFKKAISNLKKKIKESDIVLGETILWTQKWISVMEVSQRIENQAQH